MKKLIILSTLILLPLSAISQTETLVQSMTAHNSAACASGGLPADCSDVQLGVALPGVRTLEKTVFSTPAAYRDAVIVQPQLAARLEQRRNRVIERLVRIVVNQPANCLVILAAAELPTDVCK